MKIKRLIAGGLSAVAGATLLLGSVLGAATFSDGLGTTFFEKTDSTYKSPLIVVGDTAGIVDVIGATDIAASFVSNFAVDERTVPAAGAATSATNGVLIDSDLNKTYLGEVLSKVKSVITESDLPDLLEKQSFTDMNATTSTYTQKIVPGGIAAAFNVPSGETVPYLNVPVTSTSTPYNLTVTFIGGLDPTAVDTTYSLKLFGKDYTFGNTHTNTTLELYSSAGAQIVDLSGAGDDETVTVGDQTFDIVLNGWDTGGTKAYVSVNGNPYTWNELGTYTVSGVKFYVQSVDVIYTGAQDASGMVKLFVGTDKLYLNNAQQIQKNDVTKNTYVYFSSPAANKINSITFEVYPDDDVIITSDSGMDDPVFGSFKTVVSDMTPGITDESRDFIKVSSDSSNVRLSFTNKDVMTYTNIPVLYGNSSGIFKQINNIYDFHTKECNFSASDGNITKGDYLVSSGDYSYILKYTSYNYDVSDSSKTYVTLTDLSENTAYKVYPNVGEKLTIGSLEFGVTWNGNTDKTICVSLDSGTTYDGAQVNITTGGYAKIDLTSTGDVLVTEDELYTISGSNDPTPSVINTTASYSTTAGMRLTPTVGAASPYQVGTNNEWKYVTNYGSYMYITGDNNGKNNVEINNPGTRAAPANIAIGTNPVITTTAGAAGGTYNAAIPITNPVAKFASEITADSTLDKNIVFVGGPCANDLVKTLLNDAWNTTNSCDYWLNTHETLKNSGNGLIKIVEDVFGSGKKALIVAGTYGSDTRNLIANKVIKPTVYEGLTGSEYVGAV
jgi:hypothetical protein